MSWALTLVLFSVGTRPAEAAEAPIAASEGGRRLDAAEPPPEATRVSPNQSRPQARADEPATLLRTRGMKVGGYGGFSLLGSRTRGRDVAYIGGEAAVLLDHRLAIGIAGYGLASRVEESTGFDASRRLGFGYGGLLVRYSFLTGVPYYLTLGTLVGAGGVAYVPDWNGDWSDEDEVEADPLFVAEPSITGHLNVTRWMRVGIQLSYRFVSTIHHRTEQTRPTDRELSGFAYGGHLQFGWF